MKSQVPSLLLDYLLYHAHDAEACRLSKGNLILYTFIAWTNFLWWRMKLFNHGNFERMDPACSTELNKAFTIAALRRPVLEEGQLMDTQAAVI